MTSHVIGRVLPADANPELPAGVRAKGWALDMDMRLADADSGGAFDAHQQSIRDHQASKLAKAQAEQSANDAGLELAPDLAASFDEEIDRRGTARALMEKEMRVKASRAGSLRDLSHAATTYLDSLPMPVTVVEAAS